MLCAFAGGDKLAEKGITKASDLIKFPWECESAPPLTEKECKTLQDEMDAFTFENNKSSEE